MKFKDAYKEMNDEIHGDRALLHSILNGEPKKQKSFFQKFAYGRTLATALSCVVIVATVFISYNHFNSPISIDQSPSEANLSDEAITPKMAKQIEAPLTDAMPTNSEYYGDILTRILDLADDKSFADVADENHLDPLDILIDYPSKDEPSVVTISKSVNLSELIDDAAYAEFDGIHIAVSSSNDEKEKEILDKILK